MYEMYMPSSKLETAKLYCNPNKPSSFAQKFYFLSHQISTQGIKPDEEKVDHIKTWPIPKSASDV
jgi:hypothetical protein